jgi:Domain of unknown function (DUF4278)
MYTVLDRPQIQPVPQPIPQATAISEPTHTLIYRGTTYEVASHQPLRTPEAVAQLMGKRLTYRGTTYEMVPASKPAISAPGVAHQLCYRGVTYLRYAKSSLSEIDYVVV